MSAPTAPRAAPQRFLIREATLSDAPTVHSIINAAFNSDATDQIFLTSFRTEIFPLSVITDRITAPDTILLVASYSSAPDTIVGTCYVRHNGPEAAWLGNLCIDPAHQKSGIGKFLLVEAERYVVDKWDVTGMEIDVVSTRKELMAWYRRCGYVETGTEKPFPYFGSPDGFLREGMKMVDFRKVLVAENKGYEKGQENGGV